MILDATENGFVIKLCYIPSHVGITGNERADSLAKVGTILNVPLEIYIDIRDLIPVIKDKIVSSWENEWKLSLQAKGSFYKLIREILSHLFYPHYTLSLNLDMRSNAKISDYLINR